MSSCIQTQGPWTASSRVGAVMLAPVSNAVVTTGLSAAASFFAGAGLGADQATATPRTHKYINRPGSPPRGTR